MNLVEMWIIQFLLDPLRAGEQTNEQCYRTRLHPKALHLAEVTGYGSVGSDEFKVWHL